MIVVKISSGYQEELNSIKTTIHILYFSRERVRESERAYLSMSQIFASRLKKNVHKAQLPEIEMCHISE